jgi:hypothetical protein
MLSVGTVANRRIPNGFERFGIRDVGAQWQKPARSSDVSSPVGEGAPDGAAYAAARSGDDGNLVAKGVHGSNSLSTMRSVWKWIGLAGVAGVVAGGAVVVRDQRKRRAYTPDEIRARLHQRLAETGSGSVSTENKR